MVYYSLGADQLLLASSIFILYSNDELYDRLMSLSVLQQCVFYTLLLLNVICNSLFVSTIKEEYPDQTQYTSIV